MGLGKLSNRNNWLWEQVDANRSTKTMQKSQKYGHVSQPQYSQYVYYHKAGNSDSHLQFAMQYDGPPVYRTPATESCPTQSHSPYPPSPKQQPRTDVPLEVPEVKGLEFSTDSIRRGFIRKVYSILLVITASHTISIAGKWWIKNSIPALSFQVQLLLTLGSVLLFTYCPGALQFAEGHLWIAIVAFVVGFVIYLSLLCCSIVRYLWPHNLILLFIFTIAWSYLIGLSVSLAKPELVIVVLDFGKTKKIVHCLPFTAGATSDRFNHSCSCRPHHFCHPNPVGFHCLRRDNIHGRDTLRCSSAYSIFHGIRSK